VTDISEVKRRWGTDQRLEFIEFRLFWDGTLKRADITDRFGVSVAQASSDLALYKELAPDNLEYDLSLKRFVAAEDFKPRLFEPSADRYLVQLKAISDNVISIDDTNLGAPPAIDSMPIPHRRVDTRILRRVLQIIRRERGLKVLYHSMNAQRPLPQWRDITPHAFAFDGLRWHLRAYCHLESRFKDFILSRFLDLGPEVAAAAQANDDTQWSSFFEVLLIPNPKLSKSQQDTVARDYDMTDGKVRIPVRRALLYYFNKRLRLDIADRVDDPKETPVVVANKTAFEEALRLANV
jgi:hypothetical protein